MTKKVLGLLHHPLTFPGINGKIVLLKAAKNGAKEMKVVRPIVAEGSNVIHVGGEILNVLEDTFGELLSNVGSNENTHRKAKVTIKAKGCRDSAEGTTGLIQCEGVVMHGDIQFSQKLVAIALGEKVSNAWKWIVFANKVFVECTEVGNPTNTVILFGNDERAGDPFRPTTFFKNANVHEAIKFGFEEGAMAVGNRVTAGAVGSGMGVDFQFDGFVQ